MGALFADTDPALEFGSVGGLGHVGSPARAAREASAMMATSLAPPLSREPDGELQAEEEPRGGRRVRGSLIRQPAPGSGKTVPCESREADAEMEVAGSSPGALSRIRTPDPVPAGLGDPVPTLEPARAAAAAAAGPCSQGLGSMLADSVKSTVLPAGGFAANCGEEPETYVGDCGGLRSSEGQALDGESKVNGDPGPRSPWVPGPLSHDTLLRAACLAEVATLSDDDDYVAIPGMCTSDESDGEGQGVAVGVLVEDARAVHVPYVPESSTCGVQYVHESSTGAVSSSNGPAGAVGDAFARVARDSGNVAGTVPRSSGSEAEGGVTLLRGGTTAGPGPRNLRPLPGAIGVDDDEWLFGLAVGRGG